MKLLFLLTARLSLCLFSIVVSGSGTDFESNDQLNNSSSNQNPNPSQSQSQGPVELLEALLKYFKDVDVRNPEPDKKTNEELKEEVKSLNKKLTELESRISEDHGLWLLTPPRRGPPGKQGEKGDSAGFRGSQSASFPRPAPLKRNSGKEVNWEIERPGENWIVAKGVSHWDPDGRWGNAQLCPPSTFVTAHKFLYFLNSGLSQVELTCTNKYETEERENNHLLLVRSADVSEITVIREEWDIRNRGSRNSFAQGFSLSRRLLESRGSAPEIRKMSKTYDLIYHGQNPEESALNSSSSGIITKCPENHAICGLIPMMDNAGLGILSAIGFKCCDVCTPEEKWVTVHQFNNTQLTNETVEFNTTVGLQQSSRYFKSNLTLNSTNLNSSESAVSSVGISPSDFYQEFSAHLTKSNSTGFDWTAAEVSMGTEETNVTSTFTCEPQSSCVYQQLVGQCGSVQIPVDKFCQGSAPVGTSIPQSCTDLRVASCSVAMEILPSPRSKKQMIYPHGNSSRTSLEVLCDFETDGGGWTIIQKRSSGPKYEFKQNWSNYARGFGSLSKNFWLGLDNIHALTQNGDQELRIELEDFQGHTTYAKYSSFSISDASDFYRLSVGGFSGSTTKADSLTGPDYSSNEATHWNNGRAFSIKENENDNTGYNCAGNGGAGGWWWNSCSLSSLNGIYFEKAEASQSWKGIVWYPWNSGAYSMAKTEMKIRTRKS